MRQKKNEKNAKKNFGLTLHDKHFGRYLFLAKVLAGAFVSLLLFIFLYIYETDEMMVQRK